MIYSFVIIFRKLKLYLLSVLQYLYSGSLSDLRNKREHKNWKVFKVSSYSPLYRGRQTPRTVSILHPNTQSATTILQCFTQAHRKTSNCSLTAAQISHCHWCETLKNASKTMKLIFIVARLWWKLSQRRKWRQPLPVKTTVTLAATVLRDRKFCFFFQPIWIKCK